MKPNRPSRPGGEAGPARSVFPSRRELRRSRPAARPRSRPADPDAMTLRVTHCPVNIAGIPWENVQALRRKGIDARLVVFNRGRLHPEADVSLDRSGGLGRRLATQFAAQARMLPRTDIFHFYFGLTLVPKSIQFPLLKAARKKSVFHYLGSDIRGKSPAELAYGKRADAEIVGSYDAVRWVPEAYVVPPGLVSAGVHSPPAPSDSPRPLVVHAPSTARRRARASRQLRAQLDVDLDIVEGIPHDQARERYARADIVVDQLDAGWHGVSHSRRWHLASRSSHRLEARRVSRSAGPASASVSRSFRRRRRRWSRRCGRSSNSQRSAVSLGSQAVPTSSRCTTSTASWTACSISTLGSSEPRTRAERLPPPATRRSTGSAALSRACSPSSCFRSTPTTCRRTPTVASRPPAAATAVLSIALRWGLRTPSSASTSTRRIRVERLVVVRTSFWFHDGDGERRAVLGPVFAAPVGPWIGLGHDPGLVRAGAVGLGSTTNYQQLTALFRVEERSVAYAIASVERADHDLGDGRVRRLPSLGSDRPGRRQLRRHPLRLFRPSRLPARAARAPFDRKLLR